MPLVTTTEMFKKAYDGGYAIGAFNVNNMEIVQGITEAAKEVSAPLILQVSKGARAYANHTYLIKLVEAAEIETGLPICLHLDHGDSFETCKSCIDGGFTSVMIDASSKPFAENIDITKQVVAYAHDRGVVVEAELGAVMGHETAQTAIPYEEIFATKKGFTDVAEARRFAAESGCDWLSVAVGSIHGAVAESTRNQKKPDAKLDIEHIKRLHEATGLPLVLHGGSGILKEYIMDGIRAGIAKLNVGTEIRQAYEQALAQKPGDIPAAQAAVYDRVCVVIRDMLEIENIRTLLFGE